MAGPAAAHLAHDCLGSFIGPKEREREPHLVVERRRAGHHTEPAAENRGREVLGHGLPGRAGDPDDLHGERGSFVPGQSQQRRAGICDPDSRFGLSSPASPDHRGGRPVGQGVCDEVVPVGLLARQGHEQVPASGQPAIHRRPADGHFPIAPHRAVDGRSHLIQ